MALGGLIGARLAHRLGAVATIYLGVGAAALALLGLATGSSWPVLLVFSAVGGLAASLTTPAGDLALFPVLPVDRRGFAYSVKQASLPAASLLAGLGVPIVVLTVGWRWVFVAGLLLIPVALPLLTGLPASSGRAEREPSQAASRKSTVRTRPQRRDDIEHHQAVMAHADWIIDLGPGAGHDGGRIVFEGTPADVVAARSTLTGEHLAAYVGT
jgi:MFS family permease